jgi:hypothetical protein
MRVANLLRRRCCAMVFCKERNARISYQMGFHSRFSREVIKGKFPSLGRNRNCRYSRRQDEKRDFVPLLRSMPTKIK